MERLTPNVQNTYSVERTIMETGNQGNSAEQIVGRVVEQINKEKKPTKPAEKETDNAFSGAGGPKGKGLGEKYAKNKLLRKLGEEIDEAVAGNAHGASVLSDLLTKLNRGVIGGEVTDDLAWQFTKDANRKISGRNFAQSQESANAENENIAATIQLRNERNLRPDEVQATRVIWESRYGRKLTEGELERIITGKESAGRKNSAEFELQVGTIEKLVENPNRFGAFEASVSTQSPEQLKQLLSGDGGKLVLGILLGDISERGKYFERLGELLNKDKTSLKEGLIALSKDIKKEEERLKPKVDPEKVRLAKQQAEEWLMEQRKKRQVVAEEIEAIISNAEKGVPPVIGGGADFNGEVENVLEQVDMISDEPGRAFTRARDALVDLDLVDAMAEEMHGVRSPNIRSEKNRFLELKNIDDPRFFKQRYKELMRNLLARHQELVNDPNRAAQQAAQQADAEELSAKKEKSKGGRTFNISGIEKIAEAISPPKPGERPFFEREPKNIREVAVWIMAGDDRSVWGPDGVYPIFKWVGEEDPDTRQREAVFQAQNLLLWLRNKSLEHHGDNPNDPLNLLSGVAIETMFKSISILQMKYNKQKYFADEDGRPLSNLADEVINEAWLFGARRNKNMGYIQAMNSDDKLFEAIAELSGKNDHTSGTNLSSHFQMGENFSDAKGNIDNKVGDAMLAANLIYRNLADIERLRQILPEGSQMLTVEGFKKASRYLNKEGFAEDTKGVGNLKIEGNRVYFLDPRTKIRMEIFDNDGKLVSDKNLVKFLNFFPEANPQESNETFVRELVKQSIAGMVGFDAGMEAGKYEDFISVRKAAPGDASKDISIEEYRKIQRMNLEWAETNSWVEQRWNGAAARNDTNYRGYDAWTKMYAQYYRERQSGDRTAGPIGNPHDMQIFRMLTPDMWLAIRTESGESVQEIFEELHMHNLKLYKLGEDQVAEREEINKKKKKAYERLKFPRWTESDWASNGVKRQAEVWHNIMETEDLKFNELAKRDNWGVLRYDRQKFEEIVKDDFIKKRRYAFSSNNAINYGVVTRMRVRSNSEKAIDGFEFKDMYLAEAMFGEVVMGSIRADWYNGKLSFEAGDENGVREVKTTKNATFQDYLNSSSSREKILKNVCRAGIAAQIKAHREHAGTSERWNSEVIRKIYESLRSMPKYEEDPATGKEVRMDDSQFFSEADIKWIREQTGTSKAALLREDALHAGWDALAEGFPEMFKVFFKDVLLS